MQAKAAMCNEDVPYASAEAMVSQELNTKVHAAAPGVAQEISNLVGPQAKARAAALAALADAAFLSKSVAVPAAWECASFDKFFGMVNAIKTGHGCIDYGCKFPVSAAPTLPGL